MATAPPAPSSFAAFATTADAVARTRSRLEKRDLLATYLRALPAADLPSAATFFSGRPLAGASDRLGLGWVQLSAALQAASGADEERLRAAYLRHSDPGDAAADLLDRPAPSSPTLDLSDVAGAFRSMADAPGAEERTALMATLFGKASAAEARYLARIAARELRIGLREGLLEEGIAAAFDRPLDAVRRALMLVGEPGEAAALAQAVSGSRTVQVGASGHSLMAEAPDAVLDALIEFLA